MPDTPQQIASDEAQAATPAATTMTPAECGAQLKERFPALFGDKALPLKLRIQADIQERAPGIFTKAILSAFLRRYTGSHAYLQALTKAATRFDLDGQPAGELSDEHRQAAVDELARRRANKNALRDQENAQRELEEQQRFNRATLLRDFERTTLTPANFCALKGLPPEALEGILAIARHEAKERPLQAAAAPRRPEPRSPRPQGKREGRPNGDQARKRP